MGTKRQRHLNVPTAGIPIWNEPRTIKSPCCFFLSDSIVGAWRKWMQRGSCLMDRIQRDLPDVGDLLEKQRGGDPASTKSFFPSQLLYDFDMLQALILSFYWCAHSFGNKNRERIRTKKHRIGFDWAHRDFREFHGWMRSKFLRRYSYWESVLLNS